MKNLTVSGDPDASQEKMNISNKFQSLSFCDKPSAVKAFVVLPFTNCLEDNELWKTFHQNYIF